MKDRKINSVLNLSTIIDQMYQLLTLLNIKFVVDNKQNKAEQKPG